jgi:predicted Rossmann-fold nucleotide-binding protein
MRVLVCGGRDYADSAAVYGVLDGLHRKHRLTAVIQGGASGADALAMNWALNSEVDSFTYEADWKTHGKAAGPKRNQQMIDEGKPDMVVAFPGGRGTADMTRRAMAAGLPLIEVSHDSAQRD